MSITNAVNTASQSEPAKSKLWQCPHLINSGITIIFNNCIVYLENLPQSLNKLVWKPPRGLTSRILSQITITSAQMSPVIDICISHTQSLLLIVFQLFDFCWGSVFSNQVTKLSTQLGNPALVWKVLPSTRGNTKYLSKNLIANHFSWSFRLRSKWYWVVSRILWGQCLSPRVQWLKLCLAGGSYVAFLQGAGNPYSAAGMCLPRKSPAALAASLAGAAGRPRAEQTRCLCWNAHTKGGSGVAQGSLCELLRDAACWSWGNRVLRTQNL